MCQFCYYEDVNSKLQASINRNEKFIHLELTLTHWYFWFYSPDIDIVSTPMLQFVQKHGNTTVYQWRTGKEPSTVEEVHLSFLEEEKEVEAGEVRRE